jgi:hypothetical protein
LSVAPLFLQETWRREKAEREEKAKHGVIEPVNNDEDLQGEVAAADADEAGAAARRGAEGGDDDAGEGEGDDVVALLDRSLHSAGSSGYGHGLDRRGGGGGGGLAPHGSSSSSLPGGRSSHGHGGDMVRSMHGQPQGEGKQLLRMATAHRFHLFLNPTCVAGNKTRRKWRSASTSSGRPCKTGSLHRWCGATPSR